MRECARRALLFTAVFWDDVESSGGVGTFDDLDAPVADARKSIAQLWSGIAPIRKNMTQIRLSGHFGRSGLLLPASVFCSADRAPM